MSAELPVVLRDYLRADADADVDAAVACFTPGAEVIDDGAHRRGQAEIRAWRQELVAAPFEYTVEVRGVRAENDDRFVLETCTTGTFPGGRVDLTYDVRLRDGRIDRLEIAPTNN